MTKRTLYGLALALLAWSAPALSQSINLPAQSVYGRLGIGTGPGQAIPFPTLSTQLGAAADPSSAFAKSIDDYGASPTASGAANFAAIQAGIAATPAGGTLYVKQRGYQVAGQTIISKNIKLLCANADVTVGPNFTQTVTSSGMFAIRSGYVTIENCSMQGSQVGSATGISIGDDAVQSVNGGSFTNTSKTLTCSTCTFTPADVGKRIWANNVGAAAGPLFTSIAAFVDTTHVTMVDAAGATQAAQTFAYGFDYQEIVLKDLQVYNFVRGVDIVAATQYHVDHVYALAKVPLRIQNILWGDQGDGEVTRGTWFSTDNAAGAGVQYLSGGILRFQNNKVIGGLDCFQIAWNYISSLGPLVVGNSIEGGCTHGISISSPVALSGGTFTNNEIGVAGTPFFVQPTATWSNWTATGNHIRSVTGNTGFDVSTSSNFTIANNTFENIDGVASTAYVIRSTAANGTVRPGSVSTTSSTLTNLSTTTLIDDQRGMAFASLPTVAKDGSRIFVTDGTAGNPCTGSGTGATAFRQNGAWVCGPVLTKPTTQVFLTGSGTYTTPAGVTWIEVTLQGAGSGGQGSGTTAGNSLAGGDTTFSTLTAHGGAASVNAGTPGGTGVNGDLNITGGTGGAAIGTATATGGNGGASSSGGNGWGAAPGAGAGLAGTANTGAGGGGGGSNGTVNAGGGGGGGARVVKIIASPAATLSYAVGAGATGGTAGTSGAAGGNGGSGFIRVVEHYN